MGRTWVRMAEAGGRSGALSSQDAALARQGPLGASTGLGEACPTLDLKPGATAS